MGDEKPRLVLASGSPRRRQLLIAAGVEIEVIESGVIESRLDGEGGERFALRMAGEKALAVARGSPDRLVLGADTIVVCGEKILGKPADTADAVAMLAMLSGRTHRVITAFALARGSALLHSEVVTSHVTFRVLHRDEIEAYVASGEPLDKAGAYGIQGAGGGFILRVDGSRDSVMGLPVAEVLDALRRVEGR